MNIRVLLSLTILGISFGYAQDFNASIQKLKVFNLNALNENTTSISQIEREYIMLQKNLIENGTIDSIQAILIDKKETPKDIILRNISLGDFYLYGNSPKDSLSFDYYSRALTLSIEIKDTIIIAESCKKIMTQLFKNRRSLESYPTYLNIYKNYLYDDNEKANYLFHFNNYKSSKDRVETIKDFKKALILANKTPNDFIKGKISQLIGVHFNYFNKQTDSSLLYYFRAKNHLESKPYQFYKNELFGLNGNIGITFRDQGNFILAKRYLLEANKIKLPKYRYVEKAKLNSLLAGIANTEKKFDSAYHYLNIRNVYLDTLNEYKKGVAINEINTKYQTAEKEKQILIEQQKKKQNRNIAFGLGGLLLSGSLIFFLIQKNTKRKQLLAEQEKELQIQKVGTLMKEQELASIDAMIEGQEKERQRIANDLHDDLGGMMATVKLHFNSLKDKPSTELYDKTDKLLDEAYKKIRSIAHAKNSGVIAKDGLLKSIKEMAQKVSSSGKINIDVVDHGLENRLENSLELTIFRIIQELITNVIKHAQASEANIHLTQHENSLNIMVEDNGKGFSPKQITKQKGMGLGSIDKRVDHLNGTLEIESEPGKGTNIIIDIPI